MERLTKPDSDYCYDICGGVNGCPRLTEGKKRCSGYDLYERLKFYENVWPIITKYVTCDSFAEFVRLVKSLQEVCESEENI